MCAEVFDPNRLSLEEGIEKIGRAIKKLGVSIEGRIITSRDDAARQLRKSLKVDNVPKGFQKWQLPVALRCESQLYMTVGEPEAKVPTHSHDGGDGIRFIVGGSIIYEGQELTAGDWMFIPEKTPYSFEVGPNGAFMAYCY
jgi:hypothetical protein